MRTRDFLADRTRRLTALMLASTALSYLLAQAGDHYIALTEPAQDAVQAATAVAMLDLNRLADFSACVLLLLVSGALAGIVMACFLSPPAIKNPARTPDAGPWRGSDIAFAAALALFLQTAGAALFNWLWFMGMEPTGDLIDAFTIAISVTTQASAVLCVLYMTKKALKPHARRLINWRVSARDLVLAPLLFWPFLPAVTAVSLVGAALMTAMGLAPQAHPLTDMMLSDQTPGWASAVMAAFAACLAPVLEEIFFRGVLFSKLRTRAGFLPAAAVSAAAFSLCHLNLVQFLPVFMLGLLLAYAYESTGNLLVAVSIHALNNLASLTAVFFLGRVYSGQ